MAKINEEAEEWRSVKGYEDMYEVSNLGNVKSLPKYHYKNSKMLTATLNKKRGRYSVMLTDAKHAHKRVYVHRLVAEAFVKNPKPEKYTEINHKDENPLNNRADNLEWCDRWYNMHYNNLSSRITYYRYPVERISDAGEVVKYSSMTEASKYGFARSCIKNAITQNKKYKNYYWRFSNGKNE